MGGGDWVQQPQAQQLFKAYDQVKPEPIKTIVKTVKEDCPVCEVCPPNLFENVEVDFIDRTYVALRTGLDSKVVGVIFLIGLAVIIPFIVNNILKRFGISLKVEKQDVDGKREQSKD